MNIKTFKQCLPYLIKSDVSVMVVGHHGIGKSQATKQFAEENDYEFVDLRLGTQEVGDLLGLADFEVDGNGEKVATKFMRPEWFPVDFDSKGIIFLDEINRARRDVLQAVFQLVLDKQLHRYKLPKNWHIIAAMNPSTEDYITTDISDKAFMDRFCHIKLSPSRQEWFEYAKTKKFDARVVQFLQEQPELLQQDLEEFSIECAPSRRSWEAVNKLVEVDTPMNLLRELVIGLTGITAGSAFIKSFDNQDKPIYGKDILESFPKFKKKIESYSDPEKARIDLLKITCDTLMECFNDRTKTLTKSEANNLSNFLVIIPKDLSFNLCRELYNINVVRNVISNNKQIISILKEAKGEKK